MGSEKGFGIEFPELRKERGKKKVSRKLCAGERVRVWVWMG